MTPPSTITLDKGVGVLLGAAIGDALGWPQEDRSRIVGGAKAREVAPQPDYRSWIRHGGTQYASYLDPVGPGEYSDDTQLLLAVARSCLRGEGWFEWLRAVELPTWPTYQRGGGGAVLTASRAWADGKPPWAVENSKDEPRVDRYFNAGANGVAMRIAPHAVLTANRSVDELLYRVVRDGLSTHGHPRAIVGACIHALAIRHALLKEGTLEYGELIDSIRGNDAWRSPNIFTDALDFSWVENFERVAGPSSDGLTGLWTKTCAEVDDLFRVALQGLSRGATANDNATLAELGCFDKKQNGSGTVTATAALYIAARTAVRPMSGLLRAAFLKDADTDTLCSMTGSVLGAIQGTGWMGRLLEGVQDRDYLIDVAAELTSVANGGSTTASDRSTRPEATRTSELRRWTQAAFQRGDLKVVPDGRPVVSMEMSALETKSASLVARLAVRTADGQRLYFDQVFKSPPEDLRKQWPNLFDTRPRAGRDVTRPPLEDDATRSGSPTNDIEDVPEDSHSLGNSAVGGAGSIGLELAVRDLDASIQMFQDVLQLKVARSSAGVASVANIILRERVTDSRPPGLPGIVLTLIRHDLEKIEGRARASVSVKADLASDRKSLTLRDSNDYLVRVIRK